MSRRVVISGYYGFDNMGDEMVLAGILAGLRRLDPGVRVTVLSAHPAATAREHGVDAVSRTHLPSILAALARADLLISGGGSLLQDVTGPFNIPYYVGVMELARLRGVPVMMMAQGIGPVRGRMGRALVRWAVRRAAAVTVRDPQSARLLGDLGVPGAAVGVTADAALLLDPGAGAGQPSPWEPPGEGPLAVVALRGHRLLDRRAEAALARGLDLLARREGLRYVFLPMQPVEDLEVSRRVAAGLAGAAAVIVERRPSWPQLAALLGRAHLVIGMRLHALILAALAGTVPCGIPYDPKVVSFLAQLDLEPAGSLADLAAGAWVDRVLDCHRRRDQLAARIGPRVAALRRAAALNFEPAARLLDLPAVSPENLLALG
ncbi:MAG: polysaccharide pyruvyl transferase CsaB [Thermaerobacter sp.]